MAAPADELEIGQLAQVSARQRPHYHKLHAVVQSVRTNDCWALFLEGPTTEGADPRNRERIKKSQLMKVDGNQRLQEMGRRKLEDPNSIQSILTNSLNKDT